ncbi:MAG: 4a-hydroxytetrahydrobiopterin dehydratase [bacterium]|nr:4a-hydroxytetrahydrobiopterin dehydratase [bacterium]
MDDLSHKKCKACELGVGKLSTGEIEAFMKHFSAWNVEADQKISRKFKFPDFKSSLEFVNKVGEIAELEGHHPDISFGWGYVTITLTTHAVKGLSENDFIMAAKIDKSNQ